MIDGDYTTYAVRNDINAVLQYKPTRSVDIVFHDSFYPDCREGILAADWEEGPYIHYVEVDFILGVYHYEAFDAAPARMMCGGLSLAVMEPEKRTEELIIHQSQKGLFDAVYSG